MGLLTRIHMSSLMEALARSGLSVEPDYLVLVEREIYVHQDSRYVGLEPWNAECHRAHAELFARVLHDLPRVTEWITSRYHAQIYEDAYSPFCLIASNNADAEAIHAYLDAYARGVPYLTVMRNDVYARLSHAAFNKGSALVEIARRLGVAPGRIFAAGDHLNDLPMLSRAYAGRLAAPANAVPEVKEAVRRQEGYVSVRSHGEGIAEALEHYLAQADEGSPA